MKAGHGINLCRRKNGNDISSVSAIMAYAGGIIFPKRDTGAAFSGFSANIIFGLPLI
jgi:hypothetical protein